MSLDRLKVKKGEILFKEGSSERKMYYLLSGEISVMAKSPTRHKKENVNNLKKGDLIGELSFFDGGARSATLIAKTECELVVITPSFFEKLHSDHLRIFKAMVKKVRSLNMRILELEASKIQKHEDKS